MPLLQSSTVAIISVSACILFQGCFSPGKTLERVVLFGQVTLKGHPLETGNLTLVPIDEQHAPVSGADIANGTYRVTNKGGVVPGRYRVEITADRVLENRKSGSSEYVPTEQLIPARYNIESTLTIVVPASQKKLQQDFHLQE